MKKFLIAGLTLLTPVLLFSCRDNTVDGPANQVTAAGIDTRSLDYYVKIAETLLGQQEPAQADWDSLFVTPYYKLLITDLARSTAEEEKNEMRVVYKGQTLTPQQQQQYARHLAYRKNLMQLKAYSASLRDGSVRTLLKQYLYPVLPARL